MLNTQLNEFAPAESIKQVKKYFEIIEGSVDVGDTNRKYVPSKNAASPGGVQKEGQFLTFNISPIGENMVDLYNSYIGANLNLKLKVKEAISALPSGFNGNSPAVWIGFNDSAQSVSAYQLHANGRQIYTQDQPHEEFYITGCNATEAIKTVDVFSKARHRDVWKRADTVKSGAIIDMGGKKAGDIIEISFPFKIDLRRFLIIDSIRYLAAFAGNIQLKVKFSSEALVLTPLSNEDILGYNNFNIAKLQSYPSVTNKFVPFESPFTMIKTVAYDSSTKAITLTAESDSEKQQFTKISCQFDNAYSYLHCFSLDPNTYTELVEHYTQTALMFPIKRMDWMTMEGELKKGIHDQSVFTAAYTPIFVNSIFVLFKKEANYFSCYENPFFETYQLKCGAYGNIPAEPESTNGPIFYETCANALNTNNDLVGFNKDVMRSLTATSVQNTGVVSNDTTHFFMGFPTETDFTFQQGMTSNSPISFKLTVKNTEQTVGFNEKPTIGFLSHCCFSIQVSPNGPPAVVIDDYDLSQPDSE